MHRTKRVSKTALGGMLLALMIVGLAANAEGQEKQPAPKPGVIVVPIGGTQRLKMTTGKNIKRAVNTVEAVANVRGVEGDLTQVIIRGLEPGFTKITLTDENDKEETYEVVVQMDVEYLRALLKQGVRTANVTVTPAANNVIILEGVVPHPEDIDAVLRLAQSVVLSPDRIINRLRTPAVVQVQLDVVVARVSRSEFRRMSFSFFETGMQHFFGSSVGIASNVIGSSSIAVQNGAGNFFGAPGNLFLGIANDRQSFFGFLQALREENIVKLMAEPKLVTLSGRPASFLSGGEQAIPVPAGLGQIGVQFEEFGTRLNFLPIVLGNGRIHLEVEPEVSFLDPAAGVNIQGTTVPGRSTQRVHTTVELETGQTFVIGGLIQRLIRGSTVKVPIAGDLPFFGVFFSRKNYEETEEELVVMVTPYLVDPLSCCQVPKLLPGQETRTPDDFELFLEGILEAPRGPRYALQRWRYVAPHMEGPTANVFPCYGGHCGTNEGGNGNQGGCNPAPSKEPHRIGAPAGHHSKGQMPSPFHATVPMRSEPRPVGASHPTAASWPNVSPPPVDPPAGYEGQK